MIEKHTFRIHFLDRDGIEVFEEATINDEPYMEIAKLHASEFPEPHVVWVDGKLTNF